MKSFSAPLIALLLILLSQFYVSDARIEVSSLMGSTSQRRLFSLESITDLNKTCKSTYNCAGNLVCLTDSDPLSSLSNSTAKTCSYCVNKSDCLGAYGSLYTCESSKELKGRFCLYKPLWPLSWQDGVGVVLLIVGAALAAGGGLGGGGIVVPLLVLLFQFPARQAVALSNVNIFGASIANFLQLSRRRHPTADRPIIYFDFAMMCQPMILLGSIVGVTLNQIFPDYLVLALLIIVLALTIWRSSVKALELRAKEKIEEKKQLEAKAKEAKEEGGIEMAKNEAPKVSAEDPNDKKELNSSKSGGKSEGEGSSAEDKSVSSESHSGSESKSPVPETEPKPVSSDKTPKPLTRTISKIPFQFIDGTGLDQDDQGLYNQANVSHLSKMLKRESRIPWHKIAILFAILAILALHALLLGGRTKSIAGLQKCTWAYWLVYLSIFPIMVIITYVIGRYLFRLTEFRKELNYMHFKGDIKWGTKTSSIIATASIFAGLLGSLVGIGGGMVTNPLMLEFQVIATVASATSSFMIIFSATSNVIQFGLAGLLPVDYSILLAIIGFVSGLIGQFFIEWLVIKYNRKSYVVWTVVAAIGVSSVLLIVTGSLNLANSIAGGASLAFRSYCPSK